MNNGLSSDTRHHSLANDVVMFIALLSTALAMGGALAHALELPNKIALSRDEYFVVQKIYRGWNQLAYVLLVEFGSMLFLVVRYFQIRRIFWPIVMAIICLAAAQAIFWIWTFPANVATENWTAIPGNWETLRSQWEYSHLAGAGFQVLAMSALIIAALIRARM